MSDEQARIARWRAKFGATGELSSGEVSMLLDDAQALASRSQTAATREEPYAWAVVRPTDPGAIFYGRSFAEESAREFGGSIIPLYRRASGATGARDTERLDWLNGRLSWFTTQGPGHDPKYADIRERIDAGITIAGWGKWLPSSPPTPETRDG